MISKLIWLIYAIVPLHYSNHQEWRLVRTHCDDILLWSLTHETGEDFNCSLVAPRVLCIFPFEHSVRFLYWFVSSLIIVFCGLSLGSSSCRVTIFATGWSPRQLVCPVKGGSWLWRRKWRGPLERNSTTYRIESKTPDATYEQSFWIST